MTRAVTIFLLIALAVVALAYFQALIAIPFIIGVYFVARAGKPVIKKEWIGAAIIYALGWGFLLTSLFALASYAASDFMFGKQIISDPDLRIDAVSFGVILSLIVLLANQISVAGFSRRILVLLQPVFVFVILYTVTLIFDIFVRQRGGLPSQMTLEYLQQQTSYEYVAIVEKVIRAFPDSPLSFLSYGQDMYTNSGGSAFSLLPLASLTLLVWALANFLVGPFLKHPSSRRPLDLKSDDGSALRTGLTALALNLSGWAMLSFGAAMSNEHLPVGEETFSDVVWGMVFSVLGLIVMIAGPVIVFITPVIWIPAFMMASLRPSDAYLSARGDYRH